MNRRLSKPTGFTLVEMLIALVAGIIVVSPLYFVVRHMSIQSAAQQGNMEANQRARFGLDGLVRDFERIGLLASPDCQEDLKCFSSKITGSRAQFRRAIVHLNRGNTGNDAVLLTGSFVSGSSYVADFPGVVGSGNIPITFRDDIPRNQCIENFDNDYSFAHIKSPNKEFVEAKIISVTWTETSDDIGTCTVTIDGTDMVTAEAILSPADVVSVAANQTALYWIEPITAAGETRNQLVRYFINFNGNGGVGSACTVLGATTVANVTTSLPNASVALPQTRRVIADYVTDFQVWFRPVTVTLPWVEPHYHSVTAIQGASAGNFAQGFIPLDEHYIFPRTAGDAEAILDDNDNLSCVDKDDMDIGPERVRSAVILLSVRTEKAEYDVDVSQFASSRTVDHTLQGVGSSTDGGVPAAYGVKTFVTEIWLKNLASRGDVLNVPRNI